MIKQLNERASRSTVLGASVVIEFLLAEMPDIAEMRNNRGQHFNTTDVYQIRVKPIEKGSIELDALLVKLEKFLKSEPSKKFGISNVQTNDRSVNSGKYSSVSFTYEESDYDIVVALGGNKGESFEQELLLKMDNYIAADGSTDEVEGAEHAKAAFDALEKVDPAFALDNILSVSPRKGSTQRSGNLTPEETGAIIADIVVHLKKVGKKYISIKNSEGSTVAQFGISKAFNDDLTVNRHSTEWRSWLEPFGLDADKIEEGLQAAVKQVDLHWHDIEHKNQPVDKKHPIFGIMQQLWGANYYYLREKKGGFTAIKIDRDYVDNVLLKNLHVTEIRYPSKNRKQINVYLESDHSKFKLEARNPRGKGSAKPTQIQLKVMKGGIS